ncbi:MAG: alpha/beta fold hydrolase [Bacteroidales bacterium]|nr:alpha/beta fold hydrolase [Bacteroidales bacterium]
MASRIKFLLPILFSLMKYAASAQETIPADITIDNNGILLQGKFYKSDTAGYLPTVILLQGSPGNTRDVLGLGSRISQHGINAMTFNYSGTHQSEGKSTFQNSLGDISAALAFLHSSGNIETFKIDTGLIVLAGYSYGGGMAMTYAIKHPEIKMLISIAGNDWGQWFDDYLRNPEMKKNTDQNIKKAIEAGIIRFEPGATPWELGEAGFDKLDRDLYVIKNAYRLADRTILIIGGWDDTGPTMERYILPLYRALKEAKAQNVQITGFQDDHTFGKSRDELARVIIDWIKSLPKDEL